ncbi:phosphoprotein [Wufeng Rhinolophus sinicus rubulavirus 1]|uniref:Phosphoprotein n=1 Tax=Wufeng Rhinolophus sinicus rubulavirus 1 TaxID=2877512 RepID=A0AAE8XRT3_9MONO|nr:phosphoprotein [Wufeng Rhinolophus sinicus rubulavirus 1]
MVRKLEGRIDKIEAKIDKIVSWQTVMQQTKHDTQQIKGTLATIEGLITTMKIMDPGVPSKVSLRQIQQEPIQVPIFVAGTGDVSRFVDDNNTLSLDALARPQIAGVKIPTDDRKRSTRIDALKITIRDMISDLMGDCPLADELLEKVSSANTENELNQIKTKLLRSLT